MIPRPIHRPKVKPAPWAPVPAMRNAARHYFEETLGLEAPPLYLPFMDGAGSTILDYSKYGLHGTLTNGSYWEGRSASFDADGGRINFNEDQPQIDIPDEITIFTRLIINGYGENGFGRIADKTAGTKGWSIFTRNTDGRSIRLTVRNQNTANVLFDLDPDEYAFGQMFNLVVTWENSDLTTHKMYIDGEEISGTTTLTGYANEDSTCNLILGDRSDYDRSFDGQMDTFGIANQIYTPESIALLDAEPYAALQPKAFPSYFFFGAAAGDLTQESVAGSLPAGAGVVTRELSLNRAVAGLLPAMQGTTAHELSLNRLVAGSLPAMQGVLTKKLILDRILPGTLANMSGVLTRELSLTKAVAGALPSMAGVLTPKLSLNRILTGSLPPMNGEGTGESTVIDQDVAGELPPMSGIVSRKLTLNRAVAGEI